MNVKIILVLCLNLFFIGCSKHLVSVTTANDPTWILAKSEPIFVALPSDSSIRERKLALTLKDSLCRNGFVVVPLIQQSKYVMALAFNKQSFLSGYTTRETWIGSVSTVNIVDNSIANITLFDTPEFMVGKNIALWESSVVARKKAFEVYEPIIFNNALKNFGATVDKPYKLKKAELKKAIQYDGCDVLKADSRQFKSIELEQE